MAQYNYLNDWCDKAQQAVIEDTTTIPDEITYQGAGIYKFDDGTEIEAESQIGYLTQLSKAVRKRAEKAFSDPTYQAEVNERLKQGSDAAVAVATVLNEHPEMFYPQPPANGTDAWDFYEPDPNER